MTERRRKTVYTGRMMDSSLSRCARVAALVASCSLLASGADANGAAQTPRGAFTFHEKADLFGYYLPASDVSAGKFKLRDIAIGGRDDFKKFLAGARQPNYAPVMVEFDDVTSAQRTNEMGQPYYENAPRVLPMAFRLDGANVAFDGTDTQIGHVSFSGELSDYMFSTGASPEKRAVHGRPALTGDLVVGDKTFKNVKFTWFGGD